MAYRQRRQKRLPDYDWRTPMWKSEQFYQALKLQGVDTALVRVPGASHSIAN